MLKTLQKYLSLILSFASFGCGSSSLPEPGCDAGTAGIQVGDGYMRILCGCTQAGEAPGTVVSASGKLTCHTASSRSPVFFHFIGNNLKHQIRVQSPNTPLIGSDISDPTLDSPLRVYATPPLSPATTYTFQDTISGMTGQIITP